MTTASNAKLKVGDNVWVVDQYPMMGQDEGSDPFPGLATIVELSDEKMVAILMRTGVKNEYSKWWADKASCHAYITSLYV